MKRWGWMAVVALAGIVTMDTTEAAGRGTSVGGKSAAATRAKNKYDLNQDGKIDETERAAARQAFANRTQQMRNRRRGGPPNGANFAQVLSRFDADGDGQLNAQEKSEAQSFMQQMRAQQMLNANGQAGAGGQGGGQCQNGGGQSQASVGGGRSFGGPRGGMMMGGRGMGGPRGAGRGFGGPGGPGGRGARGR